MFRTIFVLLLLCNVVMAQPLQGPWTISEVSHPAGITNPKVVIRSDSVADVFYQVGNSILRQAVSLTNGAPVEALQTIVSDTMEVRRLTDVVQTDNGWVAAVYENDGFRNYIRIFWNELGVARSRVVQSERMCPCSGLYCGCTDYYQIRLQIRPDRGLNLLWTNYWDYRSPTFSEGGFTLVTGHLDQDTLTDIAGCAIGNIGDKTRLYTRFLNADTLECLLGDSSGFLLTRTRSEGYICDLLGLFNCNSNPIGYLWTGNRLFILSAESGNTGRLIELVNESCVERLSLTTHPFAVTSDEDYGMAWLTWAGTELYLTRVDTAGNIHRAMGEVYNPNGHLIGDAAMALTASGKIVLVWAERSMAGGSATVIKMSTVGWDTPLDVNENEFILQPSSFSLAAYPNPFNGSLRISYTIANPGRVNLSVYNVLGQQVATAYDGMASAGEHEILWSPRCGGGVYFVMLRAENETRVQKVLFVK